MRMLRMFGILSVLLLAANLAAAQTWTPLEDQPAFRGVNLGNPILLGDGTVIAHDACGSRWLKLTPDQNGSYVNGNWSDIAQLPDGYQPLYFGSALLPDGRVIIEGGEYNGNGCPTPVDTTMGAIYDPVADSWSPVAPPPTWGRIGDAQGIVLGNGTYMQASCCDSPFDSALLNPATLTWTQTGIGKADYYDEEGWNLLPNGKVLTVDAFLFESSELYDPAIGTWSIAAPTIVELGDVFGPKPSFELGPAVLRPDGTVFATGANSQGAGHTAIYSTLTGLWSAGPDFPGIDDVADGPAALLPSGNVLIQASPGIFQPPSHFYEWNGATLTQVADIPQLSAGSPSFIGNLLVLPTGEILYLDNAGDAYVYTSSIPGSGPGPAPRLIVLSSPMKMTRGSTYLLRGLHLAGNSQGAAYGDDVQANTNYPMVRVTMRSSGHVFYMRAHGLSDYRPQNPGLVTINIDVPSNMEAGLGDMVAVTNGIRSISVAVNIN